MKQTSHISEDSSEISTVPNAVAKPARQIGHAACANLKSLFISLEIDFFHGL
jgi:hypothetical protein